MRLQLNKSHKELTNLVKSGGNPHKIDSTEKLIINFSTKIGIAIQVVESISRKINKLRSEELWPQITELILRYGSLHYTLCICQQYIHVCNYSTRYMNTSIYISTNILVVQV